MAKTNTTISTGDTVVYIKTAVYPSFKDNYGPNDSLTMCFPVRNSHDPNAKEVYPNSRVEADQWINYTIHFQNTGNDTAYTIVITDTLSPFLDVNSFRLLDQTHKVVTQVFGNVIRFTFPKINLVDSLTNEELSHGWVQFKIKTISTMPDYTMVGNTANIYFDTNPPIVTNTAYFNELLTNSNDNSVKTAGLRIYPNPSNGSINISTNIFEQYEVSVFDMYGKQVLKHSFNDKLFELDFSGLPSGLYLVVAQNDKVYQKGMFIKK